MKTRKPLAVLAAALSLAASARGAGAAALTTAPFPGTELSSGIARCAVVNLTAVAQSVAYRMVNGAGTPIDFDTLLVQPGDIAFTPVVALTDHSPVACAFVVAKKGDVRASFIWIGGAGTSDERVEVISAR